MSKEYMAPPAKMNKTSSMNSLRKTFGLKKNGTSELSMVPNRPLVSPTLSSPLSGSAAALLEKDYHSLEYRFLHGHWRVFDSKSVFGNKDASVLVFDKKSNVKAPPKLGKSKTYSMFDLIKYETQQLMGLIHPRILHMEHNLEETKDYFSFATEQIVGNLERIVTDDSIDRLEIKLGVLQIIDGMSYLHNSAKMLHGNLTPDAIYVTATKTWKIGGFSFSVNAKEPNCYPCYPWTKKLPPCLQPDLDFLAPENLAPGQTTVSSAADVFSLGVLICWIYAGGKRLIDAKNNLETYHIVVGQLDAALQCIATDLGPNLKDSLAKVLSLDVEVRPTVQLLSLIKHFDDPCLSTLRQLDDISQNKQLSSRKKPQTCPNYPTFQVFDPSQKSHFLSQTLNAAIPHISETVWFNRVLPRFNEQLMELPEMYYPITKPLFHILEHCESHNIHKMKPWIRKLMEATAHNKLLRAFILENMSVLFRRLSDEFVEDRCLDVIISSLKSEDTSLQRQLDLLAAVASLSDRCDANSLAQLFHCVSLCNSTHPVIVHAKSRIVQRLVTRDPNRLKDAHLFCVHLLNPLVMGLACKDLSVFNCAHFDDVLSSVRILLDVLEQRRYDMEERQEQKQSNHHLGLNRLGNRRVSMSSTNLPRVMISAARPSFSSDSRKMSFLSADGRLEDRGSRRESRDSRGSLESDMSIRIGNGSDISDDSCFSSHSAKGRRQSWLDGYGHSVSLEQNTNGFLETTARNLGDRGTVNFKQRNARASERRARTRSPNMDLDPHREQPPARPNSFTNLGHNIVLTYRNLLYKDHP
uniref:Protein kinase domain-containing protein n=3 Tax=Caenorhabditis japonica TaxID=281687 RepID=A0A8R1E3X0_CAEJA